MFSLFSFFCFTMIKYETSIHKQFVNDDLTSDSCDQRVTNQNQANGADQGRRKCYQYDLCYDEYYILRRKGTKQTNRYRRKPVMNTAMGEEEIIQCKSEVILDSCELQNNSKNWGISIIPVRPRLSATQSKFPLIWLQSALLVCSGRRVEFFLFQ